MSDPSSESATTLLRRLAGNIAALLQTYGVLAGREMQATRRDIVIGLLFFAVAAFLGILVLAMMVVTAVLALAAVLAPWQAAVIVLDLTALLLVLFLVLGAGRLRRRRLGTLMRAVAEDLRWLRSELLKTD